jgi:hypothetical protein
MAEQPAIDPRYDPAFQRGFEGQVATGSRAQVAARRSAPYVTSALQRPVTDRATAPAPAADDPAALIGLPPAVATASGAFADETAGQTEVVVVQTSEQPQRPPWTNPFAIAVFALGVIVLGVGVWILQETSRMAQSVEGFQTQADYWFMQAGMIGGPIALGLGVAILAGVLFLCAGYWSRRPSSVELD